MSKTPNPAPGETSSVIRRIVYIVVVLDVINEKPEKVFFKRLETRCDRDWSSTLIDLRSVVDETRAVPLDVGEPVTPEVRTEYREEW